MKRLGLTVVTAALIMALVPFVAVANGSWTITNISSVAGVYDRFFGIGSVHIETAGYSGQDQRGPEETMEGIVFYDEVRDYILQELRKLRGTYVTTTELNSDHEPLSPDDVNREILATLRMIRKQLEEKEG